MADDCIFCRIIKGEIPSSKIFENEKVFAFLDIGPITKGHTLVVPKAHSENIFDIPEEDLCEVMKAAKKLSSAVKEATGSGGIVVGINNGKVAGQEVPHAHVHIIPRKEGDGLKHWVNGKYEDGEMAEYHQKIVSFLNK
jgi:histidine triad (HIT) family protein